MARSLPGSLPKLPEPPGAEKNHCYLPGGEGEISQRDLTLPGGPGELWAPFSLILALLLAIGGVEIC